MPESAPIETDAPAFPRMRGVGTDGFVNLDVACRTCGYDLRALSVEAKCPECGTRIGLSLQSEQLAHADPGWLLQLASGSRWILWTFVVQCVFTCLAVPSTYPRYVPVVFGQVLLLIPWMVGVWKMSRPDPSGRGEPKYGCVRFAWFSAAFALVAFDVFCAMNVVTGWITAEPLWVARAFVYGVTSLIGFRYLSQFSLRVDDRILRIESQFLMFALPLAYAGFACSMLLGDTGGGYALLAALIYIAAQFVHVKMLWRFETRLSTMMSWRGVGWLEK